MHDESVPLPRWAESRQTCKRAYRGPVALDKTRASLLQAAAILDKSSRSRRVVAPAGSGQTSRVWNLPPAELIVGEVSCVDEADRFSPAPEQGDPQDAAGLLPLVYEELAGWPQRLAREPSGQTLQPTALVHEAYLRLVGDRSDDGWVGRGHFFAAAAEAMRRILIETPGGKNTKKHGGDLARVDLAEADLACRMPPRIDHPRRGDDPPGGRRPAESPAGPAPVLRRPRPQEAAQVLGVSVVTAKRYWRSAGLVASRSLRVRRPRDRTGIRGSGVIPSAPFRRIVRRGIVTRSLVMATPRTEKERLFNAAAELKNPARRAAFLDAACGEDAALRAELEDLLRHDEAAGSFLQMPALAPREGRPPGPGAGDTATDAADPAGTNRRRGARLAGRLGRGLPGGDPSPAHGRGPGQPLTRPIQ